MHQAEAQLFDMMNKHTRVLDLVGGFDEYALGCLSFSNLQYLRVIPDDGQYVSSFPFPARTLVLFASDLPLHPTRVDHRSRMHRPSAKVVVVHDGDSPFEPNGYWPGLVRGSSLGRASPASQMVFIFQPQIKSTARGRLGFGTNFWANAFHLETFDDEWLSVCKPPMTVTLAHVLGIAGDQPRWPITLVGLKTVGNQGHHLRSSGHKSVTTAACELIG
jgi:hypothetical protein